MNSLGKCKACGKEEVLEEHHIFPQRMKPVCNDTVMICKKCHKKIHPENEIILRIKKADYYIKIINKFLKEKHPKIWEEWIPFKNKVSLMFNAKINNCIE